MGSRVSSDGHRRSPYLSFDLYHSFRQSWARRRQRSRQQDEESRAARAKRSSMHRPVLRLQVKSETLERHRRRNGNGLHLISKEKLQTLARESGLYDQLFPDKCMPPPTQQSYNQSHTHYANRQRSMSRDSMVIVQFVDNGTVNLVDGGHNENNYDRLLPRGEHEHLCVCKYEKVSPEAMKKRSQGKDEHLSTITLGSSQPSLVSDALTTEQLHDRILEHLEPYEPDPRFKRSTSMDALTTLRVRDFSKGAHRRQVQSTSSLDYADVSDWSLGESIMRTLSRGNVHLFDIDNPKHDSEKEVHKTWPHLKNKLSKLRADSKGNQIQAAIEADSEGEMSDNVCSPTPPSGRTSPHANSDSL